MGSKLLHNPETATAGGIGLETTELELLLEAVYRVFGYDFRQYARPTVKRRLMEIMSR